MSVVTQIDRETLTAQQEAGDLLREVLTDLTRGDTDLKLAVRKAIHVCNLLNWRDNLVWLERELYGYSSSLPWYRQGLAGRRDWRPDDFYSLWANAVDEVMHGRDDSSHEARDVYWGLEELMQYAETGVCIPTGKQEARWSRRARGEVNHREVVTLDSSQLQRVLSHLENELHRWASRAYTIVRFGDVVSDIWQSHRARVDAKLAELGLSDVVRHISSGLLSSEPQAWRQAMYSCRDMLHDLAAILWQDGRKTYPPLQDEDGKPIAVTDDKYVNRIIAYLHQKGVVGTAGEYLRAEWRRLQKLHALASTAHDPEAVTLEEARLVALSVYMCVGELVNRTDMEPVANYTDKLKE